MAWGAIKEILSVDDDGTNTTVQLVVVVALNGSASETVARTVFPSGTTAASVPGKFKQAAIATIEQEFGVTLSSADVLSIY